MNRFLLPALLACLSPILSQAQELDLFNQVLGAAGKSAVRAGRYYAYTIGEPVILTLEGSTMDLTQGFHQPDLGLSVATHDLDLADWQIEVFPNPTADFLHVRYNATDRSDRLEAVVYDVLGRLVLDRVPLDRPDGSRLDCTFWQAGVYFLQLRDPATQGAFTVRFVRL